MLTAGEGVGAHGHVRPDDFRAGGQPDRVDAGGEGDPPRPRLPRRFQHVKDAVHVHVPDVFVGVLVSDAPEMDHGVHALHRRPHPGGVRQVGGHEFLAGPRVPEVPHVGQPQNRGIVREKVAQATPQGAADRPGGPGDQEAAWKEGGRGEGGLVAPLDRV